MDYTFRLLEDPDERAALVGHPVPASADVLAAFAPDGTVAATWTLMLVPHAEPLVIAPAHRRHPTLLVGLFNWMQALLEERGLGGAVVLVDTPEMTTMMQRLGFLHLGQAYQLPAVVVTAAAATAIPADPPPS